MRYKIIQVDNFGRDFDTEIEVKGIPTGSAERMRLIADAINKCFCSDRYWKIVPEDYVCKVFEGY